MRNYFFRIFYFVIIFVDGRFEFQTLFKKEFIGSSETKLHKTKIAQKISI